MKPRPWFLLPVAVLLLAFSSDFTFAQEPWPDPPMRVPRSPAMPARAHSLRTAAVSDTLYVGYTPGRFNATTNWWSIGAGRGTGFHRPPAQGGMWDWEPTGGSYLHGDSLQGWWPRRLLYNGTGGQTLSDRDRPWWALDYGNQVDYVLQSGTDGKRTFGVVGVWHRDDAGPPNDGNPGVGQPTWAPLGGSYSAWMGLRRHGDTRFVDPITNNPFNDDCAQFNLHFSASSTGSDKGFPGYAGQMDQMLFRDIDLSAAPGANLTLSFSYRLRLSTGVNTVASTRTGWFDKDPLAPTVGISNPQPNNFISSTDAGNSGAPRDSFMVYIGAPGDRGDFTDVTPDSFLASTGQRLPIFDRQRRWFAEVLRANEGLYRELESVTGDQGPVARSVTIPNAVLAPMLAASGNRLRVVFRVKTNRGFDDEGTVYTSGGGGAAVIDDVTWSTGVLASPAGWGDFEDAGSIDNALPTSPLAAWKSTGKPPSHWFHPHPLADLSYEDLCGQPGDNSRICDMSGVVISMGDHDHNEAAGGYDAGTADFDRWDGMASPAIQLCGPYPNPIGLQDLAEATSTDDYYIDFEIYTGVFDVFTQGNLYWPGFQSYPAASKSGSGSYPLWGNIQYTPFTVFNPERKCFRDMYAVKGNGMLKTSNASGLPDSVRVVILKRQECFRFGFLSCPATDGAYLDHFSLTIVDGPGEPLTIGSVWDLFQDAFPANEDASLPAFAMKFDTTTALIKTGLNLAPVVTNRFDVPGDSAVVQSRPGTRTRVDFVFRVLPGPGNYVVTGRPDLGTLRKVPSDPAPIVPGDLTNFWSSYLADNGAHGTPGGHGATWNPNAWNSARCDTAETHIFALQGRGILGGPYSENLWQTTYHESELGLAHAADGYPSPGARAGLGISRHKCFVASTVAPTSNVDCIHDPPGVGAGYDLTYVTATGSGYDGQPATIEGTKILPDGLFTPGTHIEYFFRREEDGVVAGIMPDTSLVYPQPGEYSLDGHRWQEFSVLPDRWKSFNYRHPVTQSFGAGEACALVVDANDRFGNERVWVGLADTLGATMPSRFGAHNGWFARGDQDVNDPATFVRPHLGHPGSTWDLYQVRGAETPIANAGSIGSRLAYRDATNTQIDGKASRQGPSIEMMNAFYRVMVYLTGGLNTDVLGPVTRHTQDDTRLIRDWLATGDPGNPNRAFWGIGDGLVESCWNAGPGSPQDLLMASYFGVELYDPSYLKYTGNTETTPDLVPPAGSPIAVPPDVWGVRSRCLWGNDILGRSASLLGETVGMAAYENYGPGPFPLLASVLKRHSAAHPWISQIDGFNLENLTSRFDTDDHGRLRYVNASGRGDLAVACNLFQYIIEPPGVGGPPGPADYVALAANPVRSGAAEVRFGLARDDRVEARVFDLSGRLVRRLAERRFPAGEHTLMWDGRDDAGVRMPRGVYFTRIRFLERGLAETKKLTMLAQ